MNTQHIPPHKPFFVEPDAVWWGRIAQQRIAAGDDRPKRWKIALEAGGDCVPAGWYAIGLDAMGFPIDWPVRHEYGPFPSEAAALACSDSVDAHYRSRNQ